MKKIFSLVITLILVVTLCGCESWFVKKDTLIPLKDQTSNQSGFLTIKINSYTDETNALLLDYNTSINSGLYVYRDQSTTPATSSLYMFSDKGEKLLFSTQNTYTYAKIAPESNTVYFKEADSKNMSVSLYQTDFDATYKTKITESTSNIPLICNSDNGKLIYIDKDNNLIKLTENLTQQIYTFSPSTSVKKIAYFEEDGLIFALVSISAKSNILYLINENTGILVAIDAGVNKFEISKNTKMVYYVKNAGDIDQICSYSISSFRNTFIYSSSIEDIALSPHGSYIAFTTKTKDDATLPSIWLITTSSGEAAQLTAYTPIYGDIYFVSSNEIMFSTLLTDEQNTIYTLKSLKFETTYSTEGALQ